MLSKPSLENSAISLYIVQFLQIILAALTIRLISFNSSQEDFGIFLTIKRFTVLVSPFITLNLSIALAYYISNNKKNANTYLIHSLIILIFLVLFFFIVLQFFDYKLSLFLFGDTKYIIFLLPTLVFSFSYALYIIFTGYYRGLQNFLFLNITQLSYWIINILTCLVIIYYFNEVNIIFLLMSITLLYTLLIIALFIVQMKNKAMINKEMEIFNFDYNFIRYGFDRILSGIFLALLFFLPLTITSNFLTLEITALVGAVIVIIRTVVASVSPLNMILLPYFSQLQSEISSNEIKQHIYSILQLSFTLPIIVVCSLYIFINDIVLLWFGYNYISIVNDIYSLLPAICCYLIYIIISGILNGLYRFPYVNYICFISLLSMLLYIYMHLLSLTYSIIIDSLYIGLSIMGILSIFIIIYLSKIEFKFYSAIINLFIMMIYIISMVLGLHFISSIVASYLLIFSAKVLFFIISTYMILYILMKNKHIWARKAYNYLHQLH